MILNLTFFSLCVHQIPMDMIKPPPPEPFELRVIIWKCKNVACKDETSGMNDLYVIANLNIPGMKSQETDTHFRAKKGKASWNWRIKFSVHLPIKKLWPRLRLQVWDRDLLSSNDSICETTLFLKGE